MSLGNRLSPAVEQTPDSLARPTQSTSHGGFGLVIPTSSPKDTLLPPLSLITAQNKLRIYIQSPKLEI